MHDSYANIESQILAFSQYQALSQQYVSDAVEARFRESLEQFRVVAATEVERHIATGNQLAARIDHLDGARAQYEMLANEQLGTLRSEIQAYITQQFDRNLVQFKALATEIAKSTSTSSHEHHELVSHACALEGAHHETGITKKQLEAASTKTEERMSVILARSHNQVEAKALATVSDLRVQTSHNHAEVVARLFALEEAHHKTSAMATAPSATMTNKVSPAKVLSATILSAATINKLAPAVLSWRGNQLEEEAIAALLEKHKQIAENQNDLTARLQVLEGCCHDNSTDQEYRDKICEVVKAFAAQAQRDGGAFASAEDKVNQVVKGQRALAVRVRAMKRARAAAATVRKPVSKFQSA